MNDFKCFGAPNLFEIAAKWSDDTEPREQRPLVEGWSTGELRITVGEQVLTEHRFRGETQSHLSWYLYPIINWLLQNWAWLLHEENYSWPEKSGRAAAAATLSALERTIASSDIKEVEIYSKVHAWWSRHALRAADSSGAYPDIYFRRVADDIEVSWLSRQPTHAPEDFYLTLAPGFALLPVESVARPLWDFLGWAIETAPATAPQDISIVEKLKGQLDKLSNTPPNNLEEKFIGKKLQKSLQKIRKLINLPIDRKTLPNLPAIDSLDSAALMFGGLNVDLEEADQLRLMNFIAHQKGGNESSALSEMVASPEISIWSQPYEEGYRLAEECRDDLEISQDQIYVDINNLLQRLEIKVEEEALDTKSIRGVAIAGNGFAPAILVNTNSFYNNNEAGKRFTLAHELCHILYDRTRAKKLSHLSGPWTSARTEKRANAFAAMFLAPPSAIRQQLTEITPEAIKNLASKSGVGVIALVEHLYNIDLIDDIDRERLRQNFQPA